MTITYEEALSTLQSMFSYQGYTPSDLDAVLRHHNGHMENTVEAILSHGDGSPQDLIDSLKRDSNDINADEELARQLAREDRQSHRNDPIPSRRTSSNDPRPPPPTSNSVGGSFTLPPDFLRIPGRKYPSSGSAEFNPMTDEQLARMLQDELFQEELRNNPEFSHLAGRHPSAHATGRSNYNAANARWGERTDFFDRLSDLGDAAKRRFQELASNWSDPNRNSNSSSRPAGNERRGLLASNDLEVEEEEMNFVGSGQGGGDAVELRDVSGGRGGKKTD